MEKKRKPWYKNSIYLLGMFVFGSVLVIGAFNQTPVAKTQSANVIQGVVNQETTQVQETNTEVTRTISAKAVESQDNSLSNNNYYKNTAGNEVHSPAYSNSIPAGASAQCGDGTYSFSQSRRGTCSHHGGVARWL